MCIHLTNLLMDNVKGFGKSLPVTSNWSLPSTSAPKQQHNTKPVKKPAKKKKAAVSKTSKKSKKSLKPKEDKTRTESLPWN